MSPLEPHYVLPEGVQMPDEPAAVPGLLARTVAALQSQDRMVATNWDLETFEVLPITGDGESTVGVVMSSSMSVVFYGVWPDTVDQEYRSQTAEMVLRANTKLYTCAFEFDPDRGLLSVRSGLEIGQVELGPDVLGGLLGNALEEVESVYAEFEATIAAVTTGRASAEQALTDKRNSSRA